MFPGFRSQWPITTDLAVLRARVHAFGAGAGLRGQRLQDLAIAAHEAATNVLRHGGGRGTLIASRDASGVSLEVVDAAGALTEAHLATVPDLEHGGGAGLLLVRTLCDEVSVERVRGAARLRLRMRTAGPRPVASMAREAA
ncbi:ATP-binding protein [Nonomuraea sp. CA-218870]|uniref:ATP-binding protein n=1 Tax=Nonomuraea sp. CA-218870 TaxID=3239998 RepID=UPI003D94D3FB